MSEQQLSALFLDFDSYFATVEQHLQPWLKGKPVGVAPVMAETSCCIAASQEAKLHGVKTGTAIRDARQLCPEITIVQTRPEKYVECHHRLIAAIESAIHVEKVLSIDELWCWLPYNLREPEQLTRIGENIKRAIREQVTEDITCTIGVSTNRWLAKMASKMKKPNGFLILEAQDLPEALYPLKLSDLTGVGRSMELRLHARGVHDVQSLCQLSRREMARIWGGIEGERFWMQLHGMELPELESRRRTIGHSHVLPPENRSPDKALSVVHKLTQKAAIRLRKHGCLAGSLSLHLKYVQGFQWVEELRFEHSDDSLHFAKAVRLLWKRRPEKKSPLLHVGMQFHNLLEQTNYTPSLFSQANPCRERLNKALDTIRDKHGVKSIFLGSEKDGWSAAPMRISFTHIPDVRSEDR